MSGVNRCRGRRLLPAQTALRAVSRRLSVGTLRNWPATRIGPTFVKIGKADLYPAGAPDRATFAPVLTEKFPYPTQTEANDAYRRLLAAMPQVGDGDSVWLFGCKPGALDAQTERVTRYRGPFVHCATDSLDAAGRRLARVTVNFAYQNSVWNMQPVYPPLSPVPWRSHEASPHDRWWWVPWRDRYQ
jgi:hypothetical protein